MTSQVPCLSGIFALTHQNTGLPHVDAPAGARRSGGKGVSVEAILRTGYQLHPIPRVGPYLGHPSPSASVRGQGWMVAQETRLGKRHWGVEQGVVQGKVLEPQESISLPESPPHSSHPGSQ